MYGICAGTCQPHLSGLSVTFIFPAQLQDLTSSYLQTFLMSIEALGCKEYLRDTVSHALHKFIITGMWRTMVRYSNGPMRCVH
jgi:hypothetical protein